jgi:hypothetical protein
LLLKVLVKGAVKKAKASQQKARMMQSRYTPAKLNWPYNHPPKIPPVKIPKN